MNRRDGKTTDMPAQCNADERTVPVEIWHHVLPHLTCRQRLLKELASSLEGILLRTTDVTSFELYLLNEAGDSLSSVVFWSADKGDETAPTRKSVAIGEDVCGYVAQTGRLYHVPDVTQEPRCLDTGRERSGSELAIPLLVDEVERSADAVDESASVRLQGSPRQKILGVFDVRCDRPDAFSSSTREFIVSVADQVAIALDYVLRYDRLENVVRQSESQIQEQTRELRIERDRANFLYRVTQEMTRTMDLDRVLNRTLARVSRTLGVRRGSILLLDPESGYLLYRAALGRAVALPQGGKRTFYRRGVGLAGWVLEHNECAIVNGPDQDPRWDVDPENKGESQSVLAAPLSAGREVLGVMLLFHPQPGYFNQDHVWLATAAANHITAAIKNTELYRLVREQAARLGQMLREQRGVAAQRMAILSSIADGVAVSDEHDRIIVVNDAARRIMHLAARELIGQPASTLFDGCPEEALQATLQAMAEITARSRSEQYTEPVSITLTCEERIIQASFMPMSDERQRFSGTVIVLRDVTVEHEIAQAKNEFVSIVAHELRTPMTSIKGYTDLLLKGAMGTLAEGQQRFLNIVKTNVDRMATLVSDLLDISRIEAGRIKLEPAPLKLAQIVREVGDSLAETIKQRDLALELDLVSTVPTVHADRNRIIQVLTNLLSNAYRYTPAGGMITVSVHPVNGAVQVDVTDTGIGIAEEDQERIFERFYRVDHPVVNQQTGTGLGLPIVKSLIELHKGKLWLKSRLGEGSTFSFTLPVKDTV